MRLAFVLSLSAVALVTAAACSDQENPTLPGATERPPAPTPDEDAGTEDDATAPDDNVVITGDPTKGILLEATVLGETGPFEGMVLVGPDGTIACAAPGDACANDPTAAEAARVKLTGVVAPGLIDTHNHIMFDIFDGTDWLPERVYQNHDQWPNEQRYKEMSDIKQCLEDASQGKPTWCPAKYDGAGSLRCEMQKFGEMKGLVAGTTSIVGLPGTGFPCYGSLARSIDTQFNGLNEDKIQTAAIMPSRSTADGVCRNYADGKTVAYLMHIGEGVDDRSRNEFTQLGTLTTIPGCLYAPQTAITHGTAFGAAEFGVMKSKGMKLIWSPASNLALYGQTTNVPMALDHGILVALAPDWSMGGSPNMLEELRVAKKVSVEKWNGRLTSKDIVEMGTKNAATILGLGDRLGTLKKGYIGDLFVVRKGGAADAYEAIVAAKPTDVRLTMIAGKVLYGDDALRKIAAFGAACEDLDVCGTKKFACVAVPGVQEDKLNQTFEQIKGALDAALADLDVARAVVGDGLKFSPLTPLVMCNK